MKFIEEGEKENQMTDREGSTEQQIEAKMRGKQRSEGENEVCERYGDDVVD